MAYISLYRRYRPRSFSEIVGQDVIIRILVNSIVNDKIGHAYIFSGPRGTGKTSTAKIFAKAINCLNPKKGDICGKCDVCKSNFDDEIDIVEIDAASNNGVEEIREIRNSVKLTPSRLKYKVYIIDEVHMLSGSAFNALLKTLEEPPAHVVFILATTEVNKIPLTVLSRCQKFDFKKIGDSDVKKQLENILKRENKTLSDDVLKLISNLSDGGMRDAINTLDQLLSIQKDNITTDDVYDLIGDVNEDKIFDILDSMVENDIKKELELLNIFYDSGKNFVNICERLQMLIRNLIIYNNTTNYFSKNYEKKLEKYSKLDVENCCKISEILFTLITDLKKTTNQKTLVEIYFLKISLLFSEKKEKIINNESAQEISTKTENDKIIENENIDTSYKNNRINNALAEADKKLKISFAQKYTEIKENVSVKEFNSLANLLLKSTPEVVSKRTILFSFKNNFEVLLFDKNMEEIQKFLKKITEKKYDIVAVTACDWNIIKNKYINDLEKGIKYEYISENPEKIKKKSKSTVLQNTVENIFGDEYITIS